jgi:thiol-disulfide isomerase/thioredoxin
MESVGSKWVIMIIGVVKVYCHMLLHTFKQSIALLAILLCPQLTAAQLLTTLAGKIEGAENQRLLLVPDLSMLKYDDMSILSDSCQTNAEGRFAFRFEMNSGGLYQLLNQEGHRLLSNVFIQPGDSVFVETTTNYDNPYIRAVGKGSQRASYTKMYAIHFYPDDWDKNINGVNYNGKKESKFWELNDSVRALKLAFMDTHLPATPDNAAFRNILERGYNLEHTTIAYEYLNWHISTASDTTGYPYLFEDKDFYARLVDLRKLDSIGYSLGAYSTIVRAYMNDRLKWYQRGLPDTLKWKRENIDYETILRDSLPVAWLQLALLERASRVSMNMGDTGAIASLNRLIKFGKERGISTKAVAIMEEEAKKMARYLPGAQMPDFTLPDSAGKPVSLSDFRGKTVFIDFWGTWCGPCLASLPAHVALEEEMAGKEVVFLNVAAEATDQIPVWREFIRTKTFNGKPVGGVHVVAEGQGANKVIKSLGIRAYPTFILIDPDGRIILYSLLNFTKTGDVLRAYLK